MNQLNCIGGWISSVLDFRKGVTINRIAPIIITANPHSICTEFIIPSAIPLKGFPCKSRVNCAWLFFIKLSILKYVKPKVPRAVMPVEISGLYFLNRTKIIEIMPNAKMSIPSPCPLLYNSFDQRWGFSQ